MNKTARQTNLRLTVARRPGQKWIDHKLESTALRDALAQTRKRTETLSDILRGVCRDACNDVRTCGGADSVARIETVRYLLRICRFCVESGMVAASERETTSKGIQSPLTVADWIDGMEHCVKHHRPPGWTDTRQREFRALSDRLDVIAGMLATRPEDKNAYESLVESEEIYG